MIHSVAELELVLSDPPVGIELECRPAAPLPVDHVAWRDQALSSHAGTVAILSSRALRTDGGWPLFMVRSDVVAAQRTVERRVHAFYAIDRYGAVAIARGHVDQHGDELEALFRAARTRHHRRVVALAQVWEGFDEDAPSSMRLP